MTSNGVTLWDGTTWDGNIIPNDTLSFMMCQYWQSAGIGTLFVYIQTGAKKASGFTPLKY